MTVSSTTTSVAYTGNASTTTFAVTFPFLGTGATSELTVVERTIATGAEVTLSYTTHYTVTGGNGNTGAVVAGTAPAATVQWHIRRNTATTQSVDYVTNDPFAADTHELALDRLTMSGQERDGDITQAFRYPDTYAGGASNTVPEPGAGKVLQWNAAGNALENGPTASNISGASTSATNAANSATAAASSASTATAQATISTNFAIKVDGAAAGSDHSSKAWAIGGTGVTDTSSKGAAKEWATETSGNVDGTNFSAKEHAIGVQSGTGGSAKQWALGGGSFDVNTAITGSDFSAKKSAAAAAASAAQAASGQIYSTVVNQTAATLSPALSADGTYFLCDTSSNNITITLPAIGTSEGVKYAFQKTSASNSLIFARSGSDTLNGSASNITITDVNAQIQFVSDNASPDNWVAVQMSQVTVGTGLSKTGSVISIDQTHLKQVIAIACSDETTALSAATAVATFHMPYAFTVTGVKASVTTAPAGSVLTVDINEAGSTILTTKLTIDASEKTSATAATAAVVGGAGPALADNALMTVDLDGVGSGTAGTGLKIYLIGHAT